MKCWLCTAEFSSKRDLKAHLAAPPHDRMRVICPWCHLEEKQHRLDIKGLPEDYFGEPNGFYLALHPKDYVWIVRPTDYHSQPAKMARWAISNWLNRCKRPSRSRNEWIDGWVSCTMDASQHNIPQKRPRLEEPEPYSPTTPSVGDDDIQLDSVLLGNGNTRAYFFSEGQGFLTWYEIHLSDNVLKERRYFESLSRKLMVSLDPNRNRPSSGGFEIKDEAIKETLCQKLGIPSSFVTSFFRKTVSTSEIVQEYPCPVPAADAAMNCQPTMPESSKCSADNQLATPLTSEKPKRVLTLSRGVEFPIQGNTIEPPNVPLDTMTEFSKPVTRSPTIVVSSLNMTSQPIMSKVVALETPLDLSTLPSKAFISPPKMFTMSKNQIRARKLLTTGSMPLFPPARRDWDKEEIVQFTAGPLSILWPPRSWKKMSADRKLLSVEYVAMTLEASLTPGHIPNIDRSDLIDRYNLLVLPGTSFVLTSQPFRKSRYYNYEVLRVIAVGQDIPDSSRFLDILEEGAKCRDQSLDPILSILEKANVGLRLEP
ncbi:hypothetical protein ACJMK2_037502 [Sinanodonta woodiana]|uniref:C2H2-type domain-containing protein n=1 Tax=Sinanodonta woodiana TaxID=1069815 RepID=A0ABD3WP39_SINWO